MLGDWYAEILFVRRRQVLLCISEHARLPVVIPASEFKTAGVRLIAAMADVPCQGRERWVRGRNVRERALCRFGTPLS